MSVSKKVMNRGKRPMKCLVCDETTTSTFGICSVCSKNLNNAMQQSGVFNPYSDKVICTDCHKETVSVYGIHSHCRFARAKQYPRPKEKLLCWEDEEDKQFRAEQSGEPGTNADRQDQQYHGTTPSDDP